MVLTAIFCYEMVRRGLGVVVPVLGSIFSRTLPCLTYTSAHITTLRLDGDVGRGWDQAYFCLRLVNVYEWGSRVRGGV
jgi:hypothetical protein